MEEVKPVKKLSYDKFNTDKEQFYMDGVKAYKKCSFYKDKIIIGISGHRFDKSLDAVVKKFVNYYLIPNKDKIKYLISGGATGFDLEVIKACYKHGIPYKVRLAFQEDHRKMSDDVFKGAMEISWEKNKYGSSKDKQHYQQRNIKIVNESDEMHVFLKKQGGTLNTIKYAMDSKNRPIFNWSNITFVKVPKGYTDLTFAGYRKIWYSHILKEYDLNNMKRKLYKG